MRRDLVGINLTTAGHLADALSRAADDLGAWATEALAAARLADLPAVAALRLAAAAQWADEQARDVRALVARLAEVDDGPARWFGGTDIAFAHPFRSAGLARAVLAAIERGDFGDARHLLGGHADDPVLATVLVDGLGVDGVLRLLQIGHREWDRADERDLVLALGDALALAARHGTACVSIDDLGARAERLDVPVSALALLFVGGARFPTVDLRSAVATIVTPINASLRAQPGLGVGPSWIPGVGDARVVVLDAVARDRDAAMQAVGSADLDDLLPGELAYADGGVALARVLLAATTPEGHPGPLTTLSPVDTGLAGVNAQRVIEWIGEHRDAPLAVQAEIGRLATPWIGSFRSPGLDEVVRQHLPLDPELGRAFLTYGQARAGVDDDLQQAAWQWAAAELHDLCGPRFDGAGFDAVGSVLGTVTITRLDADVERAVGEDERLRRQADLWHRAGDLVLARLPSPARQAAEAVTERAIDRVLPVADRELALWREGRDEAVLHEHLALDHLAATMLWSRRADNDYVSRVPRRLLVDPSDPDQGLRTPLTLDAADIEAWTRWRADLAAGGAAPLQVAGDQFLAETRR